MHRNADLDALASAQYLKECFGEAVLVADGLDRHAKRIARGFGIEVLSEIPEDASYIIAVDTASADLLGKFSSIEVDEIYDHHESNNFSVEKGIVDPSYPSCSELLYDNLKCEISRETALLLLLGIVTDTLWFKHGNQRTLRIFGEIMEKYGIEMKDVLSLTSTLSFGERVSALKGFQRLIYRSYGYKIVAVTKVSAHESIVANAILEFADVVFVGSSRGGDVRITGRSRDINLLEIYSELSEDFPCKFGGHRNAAGANCTGDVEAILNALLSISASRLKG
jgi:nanoRNase/pAp phosphatase (c-di-AMP/oligoRNAs hydrolase)